MAPLAPELRRDLDKAIVEARGLAEAAARASLERLGISSEQAPAGQSDEDRRLRVQLRAKRRAEGSERVVEEIAYEQWHRMLFARFLAENNLLLHPEGAPVSLAEVKDLAAEEGERDMWLLAARYAARMLPGIFRAEDPANRISFAPEDRSRLEAVLERLPAAVFTSDDGLGWVYQFWQSQRKDEVNKRGDKIGGADLPAVTQLFTEQYMVRFLLENSLGAWWAGRHPQSPLLKEWEYLRFRDDGTPAAGTFEGWPKTAAEITVMDPCCGSGHFLVAAADMLRKMRAEEEGLNPAQSATAVIADNLYGLELDARCLQLAAFNLALDAWKAGGYQPLPIPNLACTGIAIKGQRADWQRLAGDDENMRAALDRLYDLFQDAPELGSLIDPRSAAASGTVWQVDVDQLLAKLDKALSREQASDPAAAVFGEAAAGTAKAAQLLAGRYWLVATNPPYVAYNKQSDVLRSWIDQRLPTASQLATAFVIRGFTFAARSAHIAMVTPQAWMTLRTFDSLRERVRSSATVRLLAILGPRGFQTPMYDFSLCLLTLLAHPTGSDDHFAGLDVGSERTPNEKALRLRQDGLLQVDRRLAGSAGRPISLEPDEGRATIGDFARTLTGIQTGDDPRFRRRFWEIADGGEWRFDQATVNTTEPYGGRQWILQWRRGGAELRENKQAFVRGSEAWGKRGIAISQMGELPVSLYSGDAWNMNCCVLLPNEAGMLTPIWAFAASSDFAAAVRRIDRSTKVNPGYFLRVPFDLEHWQKVAAEQYPNGLPEPHSDDATQWLFKGNVVGSEAPLHVAVARLLGYRWPDQEPDALDELADADGLVPLVSAGGELPAADRLRELLGRAYGDEWSPRLLERLLAEAGSPGKTLEAWLRDDFFTQHTKLFHNRPFIWHVWDGLKDGFSVLCHYHRLDQAKLGRLTYTLLNDWIERQRAARDEPGAETRRNAALNLQDNLRLILEGEAPYDIYVRWKSLAVQPIGWQPDLDDGVRLNIRPFCTAGVLRSKVNVKWEPDRGKNPDGSERINDRHPTLAQKRAARAAAGVG